MRRRQGTWLRRERLGLVGKQSLVCGQRSEQFLSLSSEGRSARRARRAVAGRGRRGGQSGSSCTPGSSHSATAQHSTAQPLHLSRYIRYAVDYFWSFSSEEKRGYPHTETVIVRRAAFTHPPRVAWPYSTPDQSRSSADAGRSTGRGGTERRGRPAPVCTHTHTHRERERESQGSVGGGEEREMLYPKYCIMVVPRESECVCLYVYVYCEMHVGY